MRWRSHDEMFVPPIVIPILVGLIVVASVLLR